MAGLKVAVLLGLFLAAALADLAPLHRATEEKVEGEYLVVFKPDTDVAEFQRVLKTFALSSAAQVETVYEIGTEFKAALVIADEVALTSLRSTSSVAFVEENAVVYAAQSCTTEETELWGLDRIQHELISELNGEYRYDVEDAAGIDAYIIDTGILTTHVEFEGRAIFGANYAGGTSEDCHGHGTHVAGTVGGATVGVAKGVTLISVKVLNCGGSGTNAGVISGIQFTAQNAGRRNRPSVANMSLGGGFSAAVNSATKAAVDAGVTMVVAAGNSNTDACRYSPSSEPSAISVGATYYTSNFASDVRATFSNYGPCTHIFAPGQAIRSAWIGSSNEAYNTISGTSMASPHVCGVAALVLEAKPGSTPAQIKELLVSASTPDVISLNCGTGALCTQTPNQLLFSAAC